MKSQPSDADYFRGTLELAVLSLLDEQPDHGYGLMRRIRGHAGDKLNIPEGTLYPVLRRLENKKLLDCSCERSDMNRIVKVYSLTVAGKKSLESRKSGWLEYASVIRAILGLMDQCEGDTRALT